MALILGKPTAEVLGDLRESKHEFRSQNEVLNSNFDFELMNAIRLSMEIKMDVTSMAQMDSDDPTFAYKRIPV